MEQQEQKPPLFKSWTAWYVAVVLFLVLMVIFFTLFTKRFS